MLRISRRPIVPAVLLAAALLAPAQDTAPPAAPKPAPKPCTVEDVQRAVAKILKTTPDKIAPDALLSDKAIGADDLDVVEIIMELEDAFDVSIPDERTSDPKTGALNLSANGLVRLVRELQQQKARVANAPPPDPAALARASEETRKRLRSGCASWTVVHQRGDGQDLVTTVVQSPPSRKIVLCVETADGQRQEIARVVERDGLCFASEGTYRGRHRPLEVPFSLSTIYLYLLRSELVTVAEPALLGKHMGSEGGIATFHAPLPEAMQAVIRNALRELETRKDLNENLQLMALGAKLRTQLDAGTVSEIDLATGLFVRSGTAERELRVRDFKWLESVDEKEFAVDGTAWKDVSDDPTAGNVGDLVMIGHCGYWRPGQKQYELDCRLMDVKTGRFRRVPFAGINSLPGCFSKDRRRVYVCGMPVEGGSLGVFEVDLRTGANRRLGGEPLAGGFTLDPTLSPDGKTLAVIHKGGQGRLMDNQVFLIDLGTDVTRKVGPLMDAAFLSWLPDGSGLVLLRREPSEIGGGQKAVICRMDLEGRLAPIREGNFPALLADGRTILHIGADGTKWKTCALDGSDVKDFLNGIDSKEYNYPAESPDGRRVLMMGRSPDKSPQPVVFDLDSGKSNPLPVAEGLWGMPVWQ
jgi:acyl carrier protein